jgi:hypothetical protein
LSSQLARFIFSPRNSPRSDAVLSKQPLVVAAFDSGFIVNPERLSDILF